MPDAVNQLNTKIDFSGKAFKRYFFNTSWLFAERIFRLLVTFIVGIFTIRYLGPTKFGLLSYALSFVGLFTSIATLGLDSIIVRELVKEPENKDKLLGTVFFLRLFGAAAAVLLIVCAALLNGENKNSLVLIMILSSSAVFQAFYVVDFYFQSKVLARYSALVQFISLLAASILKIMLIVIKAQLVYFALVSAIEFVIIGINFLIIYRVSGNTIAGWSLQKSLAVSLLKDSWPLILSGIAIAVYIRIDQVIIKNMLDEQQVGFYAAAVKLTEAWYFIPIAIVTSLFPAILNAKQVNERLYMNRLQKLYDLLVLIAVSIAVPVTFLSTIIIKILLGPEFITSASVLIVYIWGSIAVFLSYASNQYLVAESYTILSFYRTLAGAVLNIILNVLLIPPLGIIGSAIATIFSQVVVLFSIVFDRKTSDQLMMFLKAIFMVNSIRYISAKLLNFKNS